MNPDTAVRRGASERAHVRRLWRAELGALAGVAALLGWLPLVARPSLFFVPAALLGVTMAAFGVLLRSLRAPPLLVPAAQLGFAFVAIHVIQAGPRPLLGLIPTPSSVVELAQVLREGSQALYLYNAPVAVHPGSTAMVLLCGSVLILLTIDLLAVGARRAALAALPLLLVLTIPIMILDDSVSVVVFALTALAFLLLLSQDALDTLWAWVRDDAQNVRPHRELLARGARGVSLLAVATALLLSLVVPVGPPQRNPFTGSSGGGGNITVVNPFVDLRRDLVQSNPKPLLSVETDDPDTSYVRLTVLDEFTGEQWRPSSRKLSGDHVADGDVGLPEGALPGRSWTWRLELAAGFATQWLPLPYPVSSVEAPGEWRYDVRTYDFVHTSTESVGQMRYTAVAERRPPTAAELAAAPAARGEDPMTELPAELPDVVGERAREVTASAPDPYSKALALQAFFRTSGDFTYSTAPRSGSGMEQLARFITDDRIGYCEQFAAAMATMGRTIGLPSRVVVGFLDGSRDETGRVSYSSADLHAWPEMYFTGSGWVRFEPTPAARTGAAPSWTTRAPEQPRPSASAAPSVPAEPDPTTSPRRSTPPSAPTTGVAPLTGTGEWWPGVVGVLALGLVLAAGPGVLRATLRRYRLRSGQDDGELIEGAWAELHATATDLGLDWPLERSPRQQARALAGATAAGRQDSADLERLLLLVERERYAAPGAVPDSPAGLPSGATPDADRAGADRARAAVVAALRGEEQVLARHVGPVRRWRAWAWPVSLWPRRGPRSTP